MYIYRCIYKSCMHACMHASMDTLTHLLHLPLLYGHQKKQADALLRVCKHVYMSIYI